MAVTPSFRPAMAATASDCMIRCSPAMLTIWSGRLPVSMEVAPSGRTSTDAVAS